MTYPNFLIVGGRRSGTTSLYKYLKATDGIFMPDKKYITFFKTDDPNRLTEKQYLSYYSAVNDEKLIGEANATYLDDPESPRLIKEKIPNAKIIILLRNPVDRTHSDYLSSLSKNQITDSLEDIIKQEHEILKRGLYYEQVKRYYDNFGKENVGIWFTEDLKNKNKRKDILLEIFNFLGIHSELPAICNEEYNNYRLSKNIITSLILKYGYLGKFIPYSIREKIHNAMLNNIKKPVLSDELRKKMEDYFYNDTQKLIILTGITEPFNRNIDNT